MVVLDVTKLELEVLKQIINDSCRIYSLLLDYTKAKGQTWDRHA